MASDWINQNVLFVHAKLDDGGIPYHPMRVLAHLRRALGKKKRGRASGIRRMSKVCRMDTSAIERALNWLEEKGLIKIHRKAGKLHEYELKISAQALYLDHRLDDRGLSPCQFRVLMHIARLADVAGAFFISERKFANICGMKRETVHRALEALENSEFYTPYDERQNPMCILTLDELFPPESKTVSVTCNENVPDKSPAKMPNGMPKTPNSGGPKDITPMPKTPNGGGPICLTKDNPIDNPFKTIQRNNPREDNPASFVNSIGHGLSFLSGSEEGEEKKLIALWKEKCPQIGPEFIADKYRAECEHNGHQWTKEELNRRSGEAFAEYHKCLKQP